MKKEKILSILTSIGLKETEAAVYFAALTLGPSSVLAISRHSGIKRATVYTIISALQQKGLILVEMQGFKKLFAAERPEKLESILDAQKELLHSALPELSSLYDLKGEEGSIRYYEGLEAVKSVYESLLRDIRAHEDYLIMSDLKQWVRHDEKYFFDFTKRRAKLPINIRMLVQDSDVARAHKKMEKALNETIKFLPAGTTLTTNLVIIPKKIVIHQITDPIFAIVIENKNIVKMHREQFEIMWKAVS